MCATPILLISAILVLQPSEGGECDVECVHMALEVLAVELATTGACAREEER